MFVMKNESMEELNRLRNCTICPRNCNADRFLNKTGYCRSDSSFNIASICIHKGEEPVISGSKGICNIFFQNCNMQCVYCQNYQISNNYLKKGFKKLCIDEIIEKIICILDTGVESLGFVSAGHCIPQLKIIINSLTQKGYKPITVYNTNGYDKVETLKELEGIIDVYLPDLKYLSGSLAKKYSDSTDYPDIAVKALIEMFRQKSSELIIDVNGYAKSGLIIRHLVLPGYIQNSIEILKFIAEELSTDLFISIMSQYFPPFTLKEFPEINRVLTPDEYQTVIDEIESLGFNNGWVQELSSKYHYKPDFLKDLPFGD